MHGAGGGGCSGSSSSSLLLDQQRQHVCGTTSAAAATSGSMLPSFGFTQEQVRARQPITYSCHADKQTIGKFGRRITAATTPPSQRFSYLSR